MVSADIPVSDLMAVALARTIRDGEVVAQGVDSLLASLAILLARATHAPSLTWITVAGGVNPAPRSLPESSATRSSSGRPRTPCRALIWLTASWAARSIEAPRGWEKGPASPIATGPAGREEHAASTTAPTTTSDVRRSPPLPHAAGQG